MGTCFVVMGFGKKTDFESGRTFDLDKSYRNLIKPAVEAAGYECIRADEIVHSGLIDVPMYKQLQAADIVIADLSTSNKNAFYELGIRHALRPHTTIVMAEDGLKAPFDVNHVVVHHYKHLGEDIGFDEVMRFRAILTNAISVISEEAIADRVDSPVYRFINGLAAPMIGMATPTTPVSPAVPAKPTPAVPDESAAGPTHSDLMRQVDDAVKAGDFITAKTLLAAIRTMMKTDAPDRPEDPFIVQRLALLTYKSRHPTEQAALEAASRLLEGLEPQVSNDTETLGLWGSIHKRLWSLTRDIMHLDEAIRAYERGFYIRNDYYNGINLAFLLNVRASLATDRTEAIADFVIARRVRREVVEICERWLLANPPPVDPSTTNQKTLEQAQCNRYWVLATISEAKVGLNAADAQQELDKAYEAAPDTWMTQTTREQVDNLRALLAVSPLVGL